MYEVKISATGSYLPENVMTNDDLSRLVDTNDEWITSRTGIKQRRIANGENTSDLAIKAALNILNKSPLNPTDIDLIIVATISPDFFMPSIACKVQQAIDAKNAFAFDISAACSGFIYALNIATQYIKIGQCKNALVIGAEVLSKLIDWKDRSTCVLFGDGAGGVILSASDTKGIIAINAGADGNKGNILTCGAVNLENPYLSIKTNTKIKMQGNEVFKFACRIIVESIQNVLRDTDYTLDDINYIIPHQANSRIVECSAEKLNISKDKFFMNLDRYGNTSAASIPIALDEMAG